MPGADLRFVDTKFFWRAFMADDPCYGFWDEYWNKEICSVISNANALGGEFENAAKDLRTLARATSDIYAESKLNAAADRLDKASKALKQPNKINEAFKAFNAIKAFHENYKKITPQLIENDPDAAADAFGRVLAAGERHSTRWVHPSASTANI